jgi:hypothetical protein
MDLKSFHVEPTQGELKNFDVASVEGETQLQEYMQVQQVPNDTDPVGCGGISISKSFPTWSEWVDST